MTMVNAYAGNSTGLLPRDSSLIERREKVLGPAYRLFYRRPLNLVRGEGVWLYDADGRRYLDAYNNVASLGHCHPAVVEAVSRQAATLSTHTRYLHEGVVECAEALLAHFPPELGHVMFTCTGSEANDLALRVAHMATGGTGVIVTDWAYHGVSGTVAAASPSFGAGNTLGSHVWTVPPPSADLDVQGPGARFAESVSAALVQMRQRGIRPMALLLDTLFSSDGVFTDPKGFLSAAVTAARDAGAVFIADEVQAGFGRTGSMWGFGRHGIVPDLVTLGKPMGNGYPIAALVGRPALVREFGTRVRYFNTFGGNPVACAAASTVLQTIAKENLLANCADVGGRVRSALERLRASSPLIADVRGCGLFLGVEVHQELAGGGAAERIVNRMRDIGVLISATGRHGNVLKIRPPLVLASSEADLLVHALAESLRAVQRDS